VLALETAPHGLPEVREAYRKRRQRFCDQMNAIEGLAAAPPSGGMFVMLDIRRSGLSSREFAMGLVRTHGVATLPADGFGDSAAGFLRINLGAPDSLLDEAARRIGLFTQENARSAPLRAVRM
jgi:arginine:pyruvate transaminase